ncbi:MAG: hypothetical protein ACE5KM_08010 [Planctomycetaceae bacterium]
MNPLTELNALTNSFPNDPPLIARAEHVPAALVPEPYHEMLVHDQHMTVTMERYHACVVHVRILDRVQRGNRYTREILLLKQGTEDVVQFGIVRFDLQFVTPAVRDEILKGEIPLGRVLINHNVFRHIDLGALLRVAAGPRLAEYFGVADGTETYGRLATIFCNRQPAVDLLEISAPLATQ